MTPSGSFSFSFGSHADTAVLNLTIAHPGRFLLQARARAAPAGGHVAVGSSVGGSLVRIIVPFLALIVAGICGVVAVGLIRRSRGRRGRRLALARVAGQYGMQYSDDDPYGLSAHDFGLLREGSRRGCQNVLSGRWQDLPVKEADYWYGTGGGTSYGYRRDFSIVIAELAATMPGISVVPYALLGKKQLRETRHAGHRRGSHGIRSGSEDFDRKFKVTASDKEFAARLIDPAMIQWLLSTGGQFGFVIQGSALLVSCDQLPATGLVPLFDAAKSFTDQIPPPPRWSGPTTAPASKAPRPRTLPVSLRRRPTGRRAPPDRNLHDHHDGHADRSRPGGLLLNIAGGQPVLAALVLPSTSRRRATTG